MIDLTNERCFFELMTRQNVIWASLANYCLEPGAPVMILNPDDVSLSGEVAGQSQKAARAPF